MLCSPIELSRQVLEGLPKIELHVHLDCCLSLNAVRRIAGPMDETTYRKRFVGPARCRSLADFLGHIDNSLDLLQTEKGLRIAVEDLFDQFRLDSVIYGEIRFAPLLHGRDGLSPARAVSVVADAVARGIVATGIEARVILCDLRHFTPEQSLATAELVRQFRGTVVAALDLAADEAGFPLDSHIPAFARAREQGSPCTAHAGEARGADSVRETLAGLQTKRIGHGVRSIEDPDLPGELRAEGIHLEVCPACNLQIGLYETLADHPVDRLFRAGVSVGINTDSRAVTDTTLTDTYQALQHTFGWNAPEFHRCNRDALTAAFLNESDRRPIRERLDIGYSTPFGEGGPV